MSGPRPRLMTRGRVVWMLVFLGVTAAAIGLELWASFDRDPETDPWTDMIVRWIPAEITALLLGALTVWLFAHFGLRYWRKHRTGQRDRPGP